MAKRRVRKPGGVYLRGKIWWIQYRADGRIYKAEAERRNEKIANNYI